MEPIVLFLMYSVLLITVSLVAAYLPMAGALKDRQFHMMLALSAGIFLGLMLFILLPEGIEESEEGGIDAHYAMFGAAVGFLAILILDKVMESTHLHHCEEHAEEHQHRLTSISTFIGLAIHAACDGLMLAAMFIAGEEVGLVATVGLCVHKFVELFSLSSTMALTEMGKRSAFTRLGLFALITPVSGLLFFLLFDGMEVEGMLGIPLMFASGTLLYVTMCDMVPEAFHRKEDDLKSLAILILGVVLMVAIALLFPHSH